MKEPVIALNVAADSKPVVTGIFGMVVGWGTAFLAYMDTASKILAFVGALFGAIAAVYTALIVAKRYHRGHSRKKY